MMTGCESKEIVSEKIQNGPLVAISTFLHKLLHLKNCLTDFNEI